ncbi:TPA: lysis protein [Salmonella enterica subsp. enterica serovar Oranienburg]
MKISLKSLIVPVVMLLLTATAYIYHGKYQDELARAESTESNLVLANLTIADMQKRQRDVAELDARYTKELADAKAENDALRDDVAAGRRRLLVNATCPAVSTGKSSSAASVDNAARPRLEDSAQRDYFTLKERVTTMQKQLEGTQDYIRTQCLK